jgi:hypothetical protein
MNTLCKPYQLVDDFVHPTVLPGESKLEGMGVFRWVSSHKQSDNFLDF